LSTDSPSPKSTLRLTVGDMVVCAGHGVGQVVAREQKRVGETERDCVVIELAGGLRITLPVQDAADRLRAVAGKRELEVVRKTLASPASARDEPWTKRIKESKAKLAAGTAVELAEIVRDGDRVERSANGVRLSHQEQRVYVQARILLVRELCVARELNEDEAEAWIQAQIPLPDGSED
jgi:CarD family transcriptional regulator